MNRYVLTIGWLFPLIYIYQRLDQYKMKILVFSIQYDFQILKYQYQYSIWRILNKYQYQYAKKTEVSVFSISILSGKKCEKTSKPSKCEKLRWTEVFIEWTLASKYEWFDEFYYEKHSLKPKCSQYWRIYSYIFFKNK